MSLRERKATDPSTGGWARGAAVEPPLVVCLRGDQDVATADDVSRVLAGVIAQGGGDVVVDLLGVDFLGIAPLRVLAGARTMLGGAGRRLTLRGAPHTARVLLTTFGFDPTTSSRAPEPPGRPASGR